MDRYRFHLQFPAETNEQIRAGEFLNRMGNKKSRIIVAALNDYLNNHPDLENMQGKLVISTSRFIDEEAIRGFIQKVIREEYAGLATVSHDENLDSIADSMLDGLDAFLKD